ncbi:MAG TPA: hypothetical protein PKV40_07315, partial [Candidatus Kapabacteria bacterium]|nr:hypothetical protein [Candidatus Kapabacteria bacterium]
MKRNHIIIAISMVLVLFLLFPNNTKSQSIIILNNQENDIANENSAPTFFDEISSNEYNVFYIISLEGCVSCTFGKLGSIRYGLKDIITKDNEF